MPSQGKHKPDGISVVVTTGEADHMHILLTLANRVGDKAGALDGVDDQHEVANAFAPIGPQPALPCWMSGSALVIHRWCRLGLRW